jgi:hypothetical protein
MPAKRKSAPRPGRKPPLGTPSGITEWICDAACAEVDPEIIFGKHRERRAFAKQYCARCPVNVQCFQAGKRESYGVWGGVDRELLA